jgi:hypothetical protein
MIIVRGDGGHTAGDHEICAADEDGDDWGRCGEYWEERRPFPEGVDCVDVRRVECRWAVCSPVGIMTSLFPMVYQSGSPSGER